MGYPVWITPAGNLGKISPQSFFNLDMRAIDPDENGSITYKVIAGRLPSGLRLDLNGGVNGNPISSIEGIVAGTNKDTTSKFTIRAENSYDKKITDRSFSITVTGNYIPQIMTDADPLGVFFDGTEISIQLTAIDLNNDPLTWKLFSGELPDGLTLDNNGLISGIIVPQVYGLSDTITGWSNSDWNTLSWEFPTISNNATYNFSVAVTDGKNIVTKPYKIVVYAFNDVVADTESITADIDTITADVIPDRPPILLTRSIEPFSTVNSNGYFAVKFDGIDFDQAPVIYNITTSASAGFDESNAWDANIWDQDVFSLPPGISLDPNTGWLSGYLPNQVESKITYSFGIYVESDTGAISPTRIFKLTVLGNLENSVTWITPTDLGTIRTGSISELTVQAKSKSNKKLQYTLQGGSSIPQGLKVLSDGSISGKVSFQIMGFDKGSTTFDKRLAAEYVYTNETKFDNVYTFTILANDTANSESSERTFTVRVIQSSYEPYESLYVQCLPDIDSRLSYMQLVNNTDIFYTENVYRPNDPYFGIQQSIKFLVSYGIKASSLSDYIAAMKIRHFNKKFYFGDYKVAQAKDSLGNALYDVIYVDLIEDTKVYKTVNKRNKAISPSAFTNMNEDTPSWRNPRAANSPMNTGISYGSPAYNKMNIVAPNDLTLMQNDISTQLQNTYQNSLPSWMVAVQSSGQALGFTTGAVLCYMKPGTGIKTLFNLKRFVNFDIKSIPFTVDRYVLDNSYSSNFDLAARRYITQKYTTFDLYKNLTYSYVNETVFDGRTTSFINNITTYSPPNTENKYLAFPKKDMFEDK